MSELAVPGFRDLLWICVVLVAFYLLILVLRLRRRPPVAARTSPWVSPEAALDSQRTEPVTVGPEVSDQDFAGQLAKSSLELEIQGLRREMAQLRAEVAHLDEEFKQLKAKHNVSPIYSEAMSLAERGELPSGIAARCGISIGEAELVAALARREFSGELDFDLDSPRRQA